MRKTLLNIWCATAVSMVILAGCKSSVGTTGSTQAPATNQKPNSSNTGANSSSSSSAALFVQSEAANFPVDNNGKSTSLKAIAAASGKAFTVFQFSGVTCESCKVDSPKVQSALAAMPDVARVLIFPNKIGQYAQSEYRSFVDTYAPGATSVVDGDLAVLKTIRANTTQYFGLYLIVKPDGKMMILNQDNAHELVVNAINAARK